MFVFVHDCLYTQSARLAGRSLLRWSRVTIDHLVVQGFEPAVQDDETRTTAHGRPSYPLSPSPAGSVFIILLTSRFMMQDLRALMNAYRCTN